MYTVRSVSFPARMALRSCMSILNWRVLFKVLPAAQRMSSTNDTSLTPFRVLVVGGSYAGLAATLNLLDLCSGKAPRFTPNIEHSPQPIPIKVTIVDERDGFCEITINSDSYLCQHANQVP